MHVSYYVLFNFQPMFSTCVWVFFFFVVPIDNYTFTVRGGSSTIVYVDKKGMENHNDNQNVPDQIGLDQCPLSLYFLSA